MTGTDDSNDQTPHNGDDTPDVSDSPTTTGIDEIAVEPPEPSPDWGGETKRFIAGLLIVAGALLAYLARNVITIAALAGLIAFLIAPVIRILHDRLKIPRALALLLSYVVVFITLTGVGFLMVDGVAGAVGEINVPEAQTSLKSTAEDWLKNVREIKAFGYTIDLSETVDPWLEKIESDTKSSSDSASDEDKRLALSSSQVETLFGGITSSFTTVGSALMAALMSGVVTVLVSMYLSADSSKFRTGLLRSVPDGYEGDAEQVSDHIGGIWRGYIYGQLLNSLMTGLLVWFVLWLVGLPGAFVFGLLMAMLNMIPTFGPILAAIPGVLAALALGSTRFDVSRLMFMIIVLVIYLLVVQLQANIVAPYITGRAVKLSPATVMIGLIIGVQVAGIVGALLVVPVIATLKELGRYTVAKLSGRPAFLLDEPEESEEPAESVSPPSTT